MSKAENLARRCLRRPNILLHQRLVNALDPVLLLLVLGNLLRPDNACQLFDLVPMLRLLVVQLLVEGRHCVQQLRVCVHRAVVNGRTVSLLDLTLPAFLIFENRGVLLETRYALLGHPELSTVTLGCAL